MKKTGSQAIATVFEVPDRLDTMVAELRRECIAITAQWKALVKAGEMRDDRAAALLHVVRNQCQAIAIVARSMHDQIAAIERDPFSNAEES